MSERTSSAGYGSERLAGRRRNRRRRITLAFLIFLGILFGAFIWGIRQNAVRISHVQIFGVDIRQLTDFSSYATRALQGSYLGIIPRDSIFFFPSARIRANILAAHPDIAAVSIFRNGLTSLSIKVDERIPAARWCGPSPTASSIDCYLFDAKGIIYATTSVNSTDSTDSTNSPQASSPQAAQLMNSFIVYEPLTNEASPIGSTLPNAKEFPSAFDFARQLDTLGSPVAYIVFRNDEVDDYLTSPADGGASNTRITYVLGDEQNAFAALVSAHANLNLMDGSVEYVDLRFDGKMYLKKKE